MPVTNLGLDCHAGDIVITSGGLEAMTLALRAVAEWGSLGLVPVEVDATSKHGILRRTLESRADDLAQAVDIYFPAGTHLYPPAGGSSMWIELPLNADACSLWEHSPGTGVDWLPGCRFTTNRALCGFMRIPAIEVRGHAMDARITALAAQVNRVPS